MRDDDRIRWHCRRGLLELDLVLSKFLEKHYPLLDEQQKSVFKDLLELPNNDLWDLLSGKQVATDAETKELIKLFE